MDPLGDHSSAVPAASGGAGLLMEIEAVLGTFGEAFAREAELMAPAELARTADAAEELGHRVEFIQLSAATAIDRQNIARTGETESRFSWDVPEGNRSQFRNTAEYLRARLGISKSEAHRRIDVGSAIAERKGLSGEPLPPVLPVLAGAAQAGEISARAA